MGVEWVRADELMTEFNGVKNELSIGSPDGPAVVVYADSVAEIWSAVERIRRALPACREQAGTDAGWMRHYRVRQKACQPCRRAHSSRPRVRPPRAYADIDEIKIERFMSGDANGLKLSRAERAELLRRLLSAPDRLPTRDIARLAGCSVMTVQRHMRKGVT